jgi:phosphoribosyl-AMP cyclohydrolase / phosphoribosyl-ATP pyrophosphohydrolase
MDTDKLNFNKSGGLIPVIAQDALSGKVLMQAYMNRQALEQTLSEGRLTLFSRSKNRIWTKGETSGNFMMVTDILPDCDKDCLLIKVTPSGPACHTGQDTCFGESNPLGVVRPGGEADIQGNQNAAGAFLFLEKLEQLLKERKLSDPQKSYIAQLFAAGTKQIAKKLGEEAVELVLEAERGEPQRFIEEAADLVYHLSVLLLSRDMEWEDLIHELQKRHGSSRQA